MDIAIPGLYEALRFPSIELRSHQEFEGFLLQEQYQLDRRYQHEVDLASKLPEIAAEGTCGACLRSTVFRSPTGGGEILPDGRMLPNWREAMFCGCELRLNNRQRAILHLMQSKLGLSAESRVLTLGSADALYTAIGRAISTTRHLSRMVHPANRPADAAIGLDPAACDFLVSVEYLQRVGPIKRLFSEAHRILGRGAAFVMTVPFDHRAATTESQAVVLSKMKAAETREPVHRFGWDMLTSLCAAGFGDAWIELFWSEEFGYLGPFNTVVIATKG